MFVDINHLFNKEVTKHEKEMPKAESDVFIWEKVHAERFICRLPNDDCMEIQKVINKWQMLATLNGKKYKGFRDNIEWAFNAIDKLCYEHTKEYWLKLGCGAILCEFRGNIEF